MSSVTCGSISSQRLLHLIVPYPFLTRANYHWTAYGNHASMWYPSNCFERANFLLDFHVIPMKLSHTRRLCLGEFRKALFRSFFEHRFDSGAIP